MHLCKNLFYCAKEINWERRNVDMNMKKLTASPSSVHPGIITVMSANADTATTRSIPQPIRIITRILVSADIHVIIWATVKISKWGPKKRKRRNNTVCPPTAGRLCFGYHIIFHIFLDIFIHIIYTKIKTILERRNKYGNY